MTDAEKIRKLGEGLVLLLELRTELRRSTPAEQQTIQQCLAIIRHHRTAPEPPETARMSVIGQTQPADRDEGVGKPQKDQKTGAGPTCPDKITPCSVQIGNGLVVPVKSWKVRTNSGKTFRQEWEDQWRSEGGGVFQFVLEEPKPIMGGDGVRCLCEVPGCLPGECPRNPGKSDGPPNVCPHCGCGFADWCPVCPGCGTPK